MEIIEFNTKKKKIDLSWIEESIKCIEEDYNIKSGILKQIKNMLEKYITSMHLEHINFQINEEVLDNFIDLLNEDTIEDVKDYGEIVPLLDLRGENDDAVYNLCITLNPYNDEYKLGCSTIKIQNEKVYHLDENGIWTEVTMQETYINENTKAYFPSFVFDDLTEKQKRIMSEPNLGRRHLLISMMQAFGQIGDSLFESIYKKNKDLLEVYIKANSFLFLDWYIDPDNKEPILCLTPNPEVAYGFIVTSHKKAGLELLTLIVDAHCDLDEIDTVQKGLLISNIPVIKLIPVEISKSIDEMAGTLLWMLDHSGREEGYWIAPLSLHAYRIFNPLDADWDVFGNDIDFKNELYLQTLTERKLNKKELLTKNQFDTIMSQQFYDDKNDNL